MPTLWVSQPIEMRSTPVEAIADAVAGVMRPEASVTARPATIATASRSISGAHVIEQHGIDALIECFTQLIERIHFQLDLDQMADAALRALQRFGDAAGDGNVIVLDENRIVETEPVVAAAADADRVFLDRA